MEEACPVQWGPKVRTCFSGSVTDFCLSRLFFYFCSIWRRGSEPGSQLNRAPPFMKAGRRRGRPVRTLRVPPRKVESTVTVRKRGAETHSTPRYTAFSSCSCMNLSRRSSHFPGVVPSTSRAGWDLPGKLLLEGDHLSSAQLGVVCHFPETLLALQTQTSLFLELQDQLFSLWTHKKELRSLRNL